MGCMVDTGGEVKYTINTRFGVRGASFQGCFYMSWKDWGAVKWHIYTGLHDVNYHCGSFVYVQLSHEILWQDGHDIHWH